MVADELLQRPTKNLESTHQGEQDTVKKSLSSLFRVILRPAK
tara:strand:+ start:9366 stop:9491 length:126 start_codon:yes stop_codon:yes gene_type:complete